MVSPDISSSNLVRYGGVSKQGSILGVGEKTFELNRQEIQYGRSFTPQDISSMGQVVIVKKGVIDAFYPKGPSSAIGSVIVIGDTPVTIIGVIKPTNYERKQDHGELKIYIPYSSLNARILGSNSLNKIRVNFKNAIDYDKAKFDIKALLTSRHRSNDFYFENTGGFVSEINSTMNIVTLLVGSVAFISLVVGAIGVMNIMLVSVSERTSEIGVRVAVGARGRDILQQFVIESVLISSLGGLIGIGLSLFCGQVFSIFVDTFQPDFNFQIVAGATLFSMFIGMASGILPATKAAKLDPIIALARD